MPGETKGLEFIHTSVFEATRKKLLSEDEVRELELELLDNPTKGTVEQGTGGVRKMRFALPGGGKSGGARIIYLYVPECETIYLLFVYPKNQKASLTDEERAEMKSLADILKEDCR